MSNYPLVFDSLKWSRIKLKFMSPTKLLKNLFESVTVSKNKNPNSNNGWRNVFLFLSKIVFMQQGYFSPLHMYQECDCNVDRYFLVYFLLRWMYCCQSVVENWIPIICRSVFSRFFNHSLNDPITIHLLLLRFILMKQINIVTIELLLKLYPYYSKWKVNRKRNSPKNKIEIWNKRFRLLKKKKRETLP